MTAHLHGLRCGGRDGLGAHRRWCPVAVGGLASRAGMAAEQAEALADRIGANNPGAANHLYAASGLLREQATALADVFRAANA